MARYGVKIANELWMSKRVDQDLLPPTNYGRVRGGVDKQIVCYRRYVWIPICHSVDDHLDTNIS
jgi:hypothetical protein